MAGTITKLKELIIRKLNREPIKLVLRAIKRRGIDPEQLDALEIFGFTGEYHTRSYFKKVSSLEVWEIEPEYETLLKQNLPGALIKITDSFAEIKNCTKRFSMIVVDNPMSTFGQYCEHFDLFPDIFRIAAAPAVIILNIIPSVREKDLKKWPYLFNKAQLEKRSSFYRTDNPEKIPIKLMAEIYDDLCRSNGLNMDWYMVQKRSSVYYFVFKISRI
jgi:hypothetical protein